MYIKVRLLAHPVNEENTDISACRFLLDKQHFKYVTTATGTFRRAEDHGTSKLDGRVKKKDGKTKRVGWAFLTLSSFPCGWIVSAKSSY